MITYSRSKLVPFICLLILSFLGSNCTDEISTETEIISTGTDNPIDTTTTVEPPEVFEEVLTEEILGFIIDENNDPIEGALITINNATATTDTFGYFVINDQPLFTNGSLVTIQKNGFFTGYKLVYPTDHGSNFVKAKLIERLVESTFDATQDHTMDLMDEGKIEFEANSLQTSNGEIYTGQVNLHYKWYHPIGEDMMLTMPGDLRGLDKNNNVVQLATYGMMAVELETTAGENLNLIPGMTATLSFPIPSSLASNAPDMIPTWSFDENTGSWIEEGIATLDNGVYHTEVTHFSFWNCDAPFPVVFVKGQLLYEGSIPFSYAEVKIKVADDDAIARSGFTNADGLFQGKLPQGKRLTLSLINECQEILFTQEMGPFESETDLGIISVGSRNNTALISGRLVDCDGNAITNGYMVFESQEFTNLDFFISDGTFEKLVTTCENNSINVKGFDITNRKESESIALDLNNGDQALGDIMICDIAVSSFLDINLEDHDPYFSATPTLTLNQQGRYRISNNSPLDSLEQGINFTLDLECIDVGQHTPTLIEYFIFSGNQSEYLGCIDIDCSLVTVTITKNDAVLEGTFSGMIGEIEYSDVRKEFMIDGSFLIEQ